MIVEDSQKGSTEADVFLDSVFCSDVEGKEYSTMVIYRESMDETIIKGCILNTVDFLDCGLESAVFDGTQFNETIFKLSDLKEASFAKCVLKNVRFVDCKMEDVDFSSANLENCEFIRCDGCLIAEDADLTNVQFTHCDFRDSNFSDTALFSVTFSGSNFDDTSFHGAYAMEVNLERTSIIGADVKWGAVHILETDGFISEPSSRESSDYRLLPEAYRVKEPICHNAILIKG